MKAPEMKSSVGEGKARRLSKWYRLQIRARRVFNRIPLRESQKIYILTLLIGGFCGLAAVSFHLALDFFQSHVIYAAAAIPHWWRIPAIILIPTIGGLVAGAGLWFLAPEARGSGVPQVKKAFYLDGGRIPARVIPAKMLLVTINIGTGASLGREGPTVQICAAIASVLGRLFAISRRRLQTLVPVGAAAGLAAAFNTPIAAVTFTLEEIIGDAGSRPLGSIVIAAVIASVVERTILGEHPVFSVPTYRLHDPYELIFYALLGLVAGLMSVGFNESLLRLRAFFLNQRLAPQWVTPALGGALLGLIGLTAMSLTGSASIFGIGYGQLAAQLQSSLPLKLLIILGVFKLAATVVSYSSGSSGGIFGPALYIGGMIGGAVGLLTKFTLESPQIRPEAFALVGMGAVFAGVVRAPVTSIIMIFEMTNNYSIILPLMIANIISYIVAVEISPTPLYDALLSQDGVRLPHAERESLRQILVREAMTEDVATVDDRLSVDEAFRHAQSLPEPRHAYPVVDEEERLVGLFTLNDLKRALAANRGDAMLREVVNRNLELAHPDQPLSGAMIKLGRKGVSQLPVVSREDPSKLVGIITLHDIAKALSKDADTGDPESPR
jgi:CIC family chloride channel protein